MLVFIRTVFSVLILAFCSMHVAYAASVPIGSPLSSSVPDTCDENYWDVLKNRAWAGAQREITQNNNLIARPDSVLSMTCFDSFLNDLARHSDRHFPGDPQESSGGMGGFFTRMFVVRPDELLSDGDAYLSQGYSMFSVLELLVLDQLMSSVTSIGAGLDAASLMCSKRNYIEDGFPILMIGGRAKAEAALTIAPYPTIPAWAQIPSALADNVNEGSLYTGCPRMSEIWQRAKCYDFATESLLDATPLVVPASHPPRWYRHDAFYTLAEYRDTAAAGRDYRVEPNECLPPTDDDIPSIGSLSDLLCDISTHGIPSINLALLSLTGDVSPTWNTAYAGANPPPGGAGAVDPYNSFFSLLNSTTCSSITPVQTGLIVSTLSGAQYVDAICPAPGCFFMPSYNLSSIGACN